MPTYIYKCGACSHQFHADHSVVDPHPTKCPACGKKGLEQDYSQYSITTLAYGNPTTVGQMAEINSKRVGKEQLENMKKQDYKKRKLKIPDGASIVERPKDNPWFRSGEVPGLEKMDKPLDLTKVKDTTKYIETGNKT